MIRRGLPPRARAVERVDAIASAAVARAAPVRFGVAATREALEAVHRLRCGIVIAEGWARPGAFPDGLERDADDAGAVQVAGWDGDRVIATGRLVLPAPGRRFPTEVAFGVVVPGRQRLVDVGRVCVAPTHRDTGHRVFWGLLGRIWLEMRRLGYQVSCAVLDAAIIRTYERWGLRVSALAPPRPYWGEARCPVRIAPAASPVRLARALGPVLATTSCQPGSSWSSTSRPRRHSG